MSFSDYFPIYDKLTPNERAMLDQSVTMRKFPKGTTVHSADTDCLGLLLIKSGQLRAYMISEEGKEFTTYRLFERDMCLFSASCLMKSIQFDITITAEKDTEAWHIPPMVFRQLMDKSTVIANYTNELMATRFTDIMWLVEQIMWRSFDKRLADFLLQESEIENTSCLKITHEQIASHLGTAREVVTRMLKYFQTEGAVKLTRGTIEITDSNRLERI